MTPEEKVREILENDDAWCDWEEDEPLTAAINETYLVAQIAQVVRETRQEAYEEAAQKVGAMCGGHELRPLVLKPQPGSYGTVDSRCRYCDCAAELRALKGSLVSETVPT